MGQASGVFAITTATPIRQKKPKSVSAHCRAISSFVPGSGRSEAGRRSAARGRWWGCAAISQAPLLAQALHDVVINGLGVGVEVHGISCGQRKSPRAFAAGLNKEPVTFRVCLGNGSERDGGGEAPDPAEKLDGAASFCPMRVRQKKCALGLIKGCCAIWRDHCRHDAKRRVRDCRQPRPIPVLPYLLEQSRQIAPATFPGCS